MITIDPKDARIGESAVIIRALGKSEQDACISSSSLFVLPAKGIFDGANS